MFKASRSVSVLFRFAAPAVLAGLTFAADAVASVKDPCTVTALEVDSATQFEYMCSGDSNWYYVTTSKTNCNNQSAATFDLWFRTVQSAMLAGRPLAFSYNTPTGCGVRSVYLGIILGS